MDKVIVSGLLLIASLAAAVITISIITPAIGSDGDSITNSNRIATSFVATGVEGLSAVVEDGNGAVISAWFKNVGSADISPISAMDVFLLRGDRLSGTYIGIPPAADSWSVLDPLGSAVWPRGETIHIRLVLNANPIANGEYIVSLTTPNGVSGEVHFERGPVPQPTLTPVPAPGISFNASGVTVDESGSGVFNTFTVVLDSPPPSDVVLSVVSSDTDEVTVSPGVLTFTATNWSSPQAVTVSGVDDSARDGDQDTDVIVSVVAALSAPSYSSVGDSTLVATTTDNGDTTAGLEVFVGEIGTQGGGDGEFRFPNGAALSGNGDGYIADRANHRVQRFNGEGEFVGKWGTGGEGNGELQYPQDVAVTPGGSVYVTDLLGVQKFTSQGDFVRNLGSRGLGTGDGEFIGANGIAMAPDGSIYVSDMENQRIQKFTSEGEFDSKWGEQGLGDGQFRYPRGVEVASDGTIYVVDQGNARIQKFTSEGEFIGKWGTEGEGNGELYLPVDVAVAPDGSVYVTDLLGVQKFTPGGDFIRNLGSRGFGSGDGEFNAPEGLVVAPDGSVYVVDSGNHRVQMFAKEENRTLINDLPLSLAINEFIIAGDTNDDDDVDYLRLKLATATGVEQVLLDPDQLVVTYTDDNNVVLLQNGATELGGATQDPATINDDIDTCVAEPTAVFCMYRDGGNNVLDPGEVWEMAITLDHLAAAGGALKANSKFMVEVLPQDGAALIFERRTPLDITPIMNLD